MSETTKGPSHPQLVASIQGLSSNRSAELRKAIANSNVAQDSNSKGEVVVRDLVEALGEDAVSVVVELLRMPPKLRERSLLARAKIFAGHRDASSVIATGILKLVEPSAPFLRAMLKLARH